MIVSSLQPQPFKRAREFYQFIRLWLPFLFVSVNYIRWGRLNLIKISLSMIKAVDSCYAISLLCQAARYSIEVYADCRIANEMEEPVLEITIDHKHKVDPNKHKLIPVSRVFCKGKSSKFLNRVEPRINNQCCCGDLCRRKIRCYHIEIDTVQSDNASWYCCMFFSSDFFKNSAVQKSKQKFIPRKALGVFYCHALKLSVYSCVVLFSDASDSR